MRTRITRWRSLAPWMQPASESTSTSSPTAVIRRRAPAPTTSGPPWPGCRPRPASRPFAAASTRWIATSAGSASRWPTPPSWTRKASTPTTRSRSWKKPMRRRSATNSSCPRRSATMPACRMAMRCSASTSGPTGSARSWLRCCSNSFDGFARDRRPKFCAAVGLTAYSTELERRMAYAVPAAGSYQGARRSRG